MLYALGSNGRGQLGLGHYNDVAQPTEVALNPPTSTLERAKIAAGGNHTLLLLATGEVYATGLDVHHRSADDQSFADTSTTSTYQRVQVTNGEQSVQIKFCSATWSASTFVTTDDSVYVCGNGASGELGLGLGVSDTPTPIVLNSFPPAGTTIVSLAACMGHTAVVLSTGEVYGWGNGRKGQLGLPPQRRWFPCRVEGVPFKAVRAVCGREFTVIAGDPEEGKFVVLGSNKCHVKSRAPASIIDWKDIAASWGSIFVLLNSGRLLAWGRDDHGQLGPPNLDNVELFAAGSEHALAYTGAGKLRAWGWGEHGNCGPGVGPESDTKGRCNGIEVEGLVVGLGAGCATSWVFTKAPTNDES
ncbi:alpha tubulin suppressor [Elasticomyces elasticus]|nr:alpha tubulin suppressor [Elasticomyces elasticus]KAK4993155.1 alpha tubulin suppressor [Elasticomyces elasticus]